MMITQHDNNGELSYFKSALLFYLKESHPHMAGNKVLIQKRANSAAEAYEHAVRGGLPVAQALEAADAVLQPGLMDSNSQSTIRSLKWFPNGFLKYPLNGGKISVSKYCRLRKPYSRNTL